MKIGPNISQNGILFGINVGNNRYYPGEPTTNLLDNASTNAIPLLGNAWGTYNTNQYGSGTYFSIGSVSSVSNNIVTMTTSHGLRTYDVMQPQTTGGGVTAGTNYFIKKVSNTQFSLHSYNSSQDGSQGYINPSTGTYKVHDSIATDSKISINSENFPTMWWGYPHLPNSGLVKEWIPNGFTNPSDGFISDCIRQHITRADGPDHMAYGANASFTSNSPVYCSFWARAVDSNAVGKSCTFYHYTYGVQSATAYSMGFTLGAVGVWERFGYTWTSPNNTAISYWFNPGGPFKYDIANIQIEQKNHPTRFTTGTRSTTQGLLDVKRKTAINVSNVSFDSNGLMVFDGTDDYLEVPSFNITTNEFTLEAVIKPNATSGSYSIIKKNTSNDYWPIFSMSISGNDLEGYYSTPTYGQCLEGAYTTNNPFTNGNWYHVVFSKGTAGYTSMKLYINGVSVSYTNYLYGSHVNAVATSDKPIHIGRNFDTPNWIHPFNGEIPVVRVYDKQLSDAEILENFKGHQRRFGIV